MSRQHLNAQSVFCRWKEKAQKDGIICAMQETINDDRTAVGGGKDMILASRYHILHQLGLGGAVFCELKFFIIGILDY